MPGMMFIDKVHRAIDVVIFVCTKEVHAVSLVKLTHNQYKIAEYVKFTKEYFQFVADHYCD